MEMSKTIASLASTPEPVVKSKVRIALVAPDKSIPLSKPGVPPLSGLSSSTSCPPVIRTFPLDAPSDSPTSVQLVLQLATPSLLL